MELLIGCLCCSPIAVAALTAIASVFIEFGDAATARRAAKKADKKRKKKAKKEGTAVVHWWTGN